MLDVQVLDRLAAAIGAQDLVEFIDEVVQSAREARTELSHWAAAGDFPRVARVAHNIKSGCAYLGALTLVERLNELEARAKSGAHALAEVTAVLAELDSFLEEARAEREVRARTHL